MAKRYAHSTTITAERAVGCLGQRVTEILISGGTLDRLVDGRLQAVERDELVKSTDQHGFVPAISRCAIAEAFNNNRAQQVKHRSAANEIVKTSRLSANLLLRYVAVHSADRAAAAHWKIWSRTIRRRQQLDGRRRQGRARWNPIVMQTLDSSVWLLGRSTLLRRTGRLPLGREE